MIGQSSPWGQIVSANCKDGIWEVSTMSHGGFFLDAERNKRVPEAWQAATWNGGQGRRGWYEEDSDATFVVLAFPEVFTAADRQNALFMFNEWIAPKAGLPKLEG